MSSTKWSAQAVSLALLFAAITTGSGCTRSPAEPSGSNASVVKIVDGDTIDVRSDDRGRLRIRVIGRP
jgi:micrococcal nuclease